MICLLHSIVVALFFASCCTSAANGNEMTVTLDVDSVGSDYTANAQLLSKRSRRCWQLLIALVTSGSLMILSPKRRIHTHIG